ncbi:hypothetical protein [Streptomyces sp. NPDC057623]|uniref:hypothetical protein n=1 Tax=Streptomyces sp. NPDC057623 TaxID=3346187 RepID=UPI0036B45340
MLSRRAHFAAVTLLGQLGGLVLAAAAALLVPADAVRPTDLLWGALSGIGSGAAMHFLNRGLSRGAMSTVVPVSAVTSVALSPLFSTCSPPSGSCWRRPWSSRPPTRRCPSSWGSPSSMNPSPRDVRSG